MMPRLLRPALAAVLVLNASAAVREDPQGPVEALSGKRERVVLNGRWRFMPATGEATEKPTADWGLLAVPGTWQRSGWQHGMTALPEPEVKGSTAIWKSPGNTLGRAWYERELEIPAAWTGRQVLLDFRRVSTEATVWVNGRKCGEVPWPYGEVDITNAVQPGQKATLRVLVVASADPGESIVWMGTAPGQNHTVKSELSRSGIVGEVFLLSRPAGPQIRDVFVKPSVRRGELVVDVTLGGVTTPGEVAFTARMENEQGKAEKTFTAKVTVPAAAEQTATLTFPWKDPRLWDDNRPNLYTMKLAATGAGLDDEYAQRFGFREFWIEGRKFFLNGTEIRLRPALPDEPFTLAEIDGVIDGLRARGFNCSQQWPTDHHVRGNAFQHRELWAERADEKGWLTIGTALSFSKSIYDTNYRIIWSPSNRDEWQARMLAEMKRYRNHPSIIIWGTTGNVFNQTADQDPRHIGRRDFVPGDDDNRVVAAGREALDLIRQADPTRPVFTHAGNRMGDIYTLNHYLNMLPLQEREEHLSEYVKSGEMPALSVEFGNLLFCDVLRGRNAFGGNRVSEPWLTEFAASYLGPQAYRNESTGYRSALRDNWQGGQNWASWQGNAALHLDPNFIDLNALFIRHTWRSWRVWGYSGGMLPWDYHTHLFSLAKPAPTPAPPFVPGSRGAAPRSFFTQSLNYLSPAGGFTPHAAGLALFETNGPTLAWIAGPADDFTDKDHSFRPGQQVVKSAALANDTRGPLDYSLTWRATLGGTSIASGKLAGRIDPARSLLLPIEFTLPATATGAKTDGTLTLEGSIGGRRHDDSFAFRMLAFPRQSPPDAVLLLDPAGETAAMFDRLGIAHEAWDAGKAAAAGRLLVIGRKALSGAASAPDPKVIEHFTREGGRVLLMAQDPDWLRSQLGLRVARFPVRRVFPVDPAHPLVADLDALDLRDWSGHGALIEAFPSYDPKVYARHGWRWGNRGSVSSAAIEKPHHAGWRPILECDFDLAYSPLMELDLEKGRVTLCTLDLEDHAAVDPVAEELARRIVRHAAAAPPAPRMETVYLGDDAGEAWLKSMGLVYRRAATLPPQSGLAILGRGHGIRSAAMQSWLEKGGRVFVSAAACDAAEPFPVTLEKSADFHGAGKVPAWPETAGLSLSDLRFRSGVPVSLLRPAAGIETGADGLLGRISISGGVAIISRLDPVALAADDRQWLRFTRWRHTRATAQILANLGATFRNDIRIFRPRLESIPLAGTWQEIVIQSLAAAPEPAKRHPHSPTSSRAAAAIANPPATAKPIEVPCELPAFRNADGEAVFFRTVTLPAEWAKQDAVLNLGVIDDYDEVFVNGRAVGRTTDRQPSSYSFKRVYPLPAGTLKPGENTIAVRVLDVFGGGGMMANPADLRLQLRSSHGQPTLYHPDYREDFELGDEPYRYYRW